MACIHRVRPVVLISRCSFKKAVIWSPRDVRETPERALILQNTHCSIRNTTTIPLGINRFNIVLYWIKCKAVHSVRLLLAWCTAAPCLSLFLSLSDLVLFIYCVTLAWSLFTVGEVALSGGATLYHIEQDVPFYDLWSYCISASQFQLFVFNKNQTQLTLSK